MRDDDPLKVHRIARALADVAAALESADGADERVRHALALTHELVPYRFCALLKSIPGTTPELFTAPLLRGEERASVQSALARAFRLVADTAAAEPGANAGSHLTLPVMSFDRVIGILRTQAPQGFSYDASHLSLLSVVAAQLGAYFTALKSREDEARRTRELSEAHDFQQRLAGIVSHDLRTPLSVIVTIASTYLKSSSDPKLAQAMQRTLRNAYKATRIVRDLLDVTHARTSGEIPVNKQLVDLHAILKDVVDDARLAHPGRSIELKAEVRGSSEDEWDPERMSQVVLNLVNNAVQHGDPHAPILVELRMDDTAAAIAVNNRGQPIPNEQLATIFDPFVQGSQKHRRGLRGGLGLGLYIVQQIARAHGGRAAVSSSLAAGTTFTVTLPRSAVERAPLAGESPSKPLVMVVDDEEDIRVDIGALLQSQGYGVATASNALEALDLLKKGVRPKLILLDFIMPGMDGETFCSTCHADPALASIPILVISGDAAAAYKAARSGAAGFLQKPFQPERLLKSVEKVSR